MNIPLRNDLPMSVRLLLDELTKALTTVYLVGGVLRDALQGRRETSDMDLLVPISLNTCQRLLRQQGFDSVVMGKQHNSLLIPLKTVIFPKTIEISTFRHRPTFQPTIEEDLGHRDITINAMAYRWPSGPLIDPYNGQKDLVDNKIRLVNGDITLEEDPLRAIRFFRFALQLDGVPDPEDLQRAENTVPRTVSKERLRGELDQILSLPLSKESHRALIYRLFGNSLGATILPELDALRHIKSGDWKDEISWTHTLETMLAIPLPEKEEGISMLDLRWAALLHDLGRTLVCPYPMPKPTDRTTTDITVQQATFKKKITPLPEHLKASTRVATAILERFRFSNRRKHRILRMIQHHDISLSLTDRVLKHLVKHRVPLEGLCRLIWANRAAHEGTDEERQKNISIQCKKLLRRCKILRRTLNRLSPHDLAIAGGDLIDIARHPPGPWIGRVQEHLVTWVTEDPRRNRHDLLVEEASRWVIKTLVSPRKLI